MIYVQQNSAAGKKIKYPSSKYPNATIATSGCGVCSSLMVLLNSTKYKIELKDWTKTLLNGGARVATGTDMTKVAAILKSKYGMTYEITSDINKLKKHIKAGYKAVAHVGQKGYFAWDFKNNQPSGHFICVAGCTKEGKAIVLDPYYYTGKWTTTVHSIHRSKYFKYNSNTHEVTCAFDVIDKDKRGNCFYLFKPSKKEAIKPASNDVRKTAKKGVDLSEHNGKVNFKKLAKNADFAILRVGWTGNKNNHTADTWFKDYYNGAKAQKLPIGVYAYLYNKDETTAVQGAKWVAKQLKDKKLEIPYVYADMEDKSIAGLGKAKLTAITIAFCEEIKKQGYKPGVYANMDWFTNKLDLNEFIKRGYSIWIADYRYSVTDYKYIGKCDIWQYSSTGKIGGLKKVDMDLMYNNLINKPISKKKTNAEIAKEVIEGKWGNGSARKKKLKAAGYDPKAVQRKVNELLK